MRAEQAARLVPTGLDLAWLCLPGMGLPGMGLPEIGLPGARGLPRLRLGPRRLRLRRFRLEAAWIAPRPGRTLAERHAKEGAA